ncbi:hypothetical protein L3Y34_015607 [Caenorhabditis briggsae]|uniref:Craniofacial development protein 1 n=1 Tax=Caenorhabditis briggsae TaxID=6238 RepID=A0AAE9DX66_CAEBR|nr:hypothetical protein L3Y34_015607 [Caenorhabditis briggsae]
MLSPREVEEDDYNSSSDEDYDPTKDTELNPQDEIDDAEEGDLEAEDDVEQLKKESNTEKSTDKSAAAPPDNKVDVDAIFAALTGQAPPSSSSSSEPSSSQGEAKVYPKVAQSSSSTSAESPKVYPKKPQASEKTSQPENVTVGKKRVGLLDAAKALSKRSKMSVLERSDQDWKAFTAQNNLKEDLESHNRGKGGYLNKMEFLDRADNRQFEKERAFRASARKDTNH